MANKSKPLKTLTEKKLQATERALGRETKEEMDKMDEGQLNATICVATKAIEEATEERDANPNYQKAKADASLFNSGLNEVKKRQKAKINYSRHRLAELGKE